MRKIAALMAFLIVGMSFYNTVKAETLMGFSDGNMYDSVTGAWKCFFLMDGNCYDLQQKVLMSRPASSAAVLPATQQALPILPPTQQVTTPTPAPSQQVISQPSPKPVQTPVVKSLFDSVYCRLGNGTANDVSDNFYGSIINFYNNSRGYSGEIYCNQEGVAGLEVVSIELSITNEALYPEKDKTITLSEIRISDGLTNETLTNTSIPTGQTFNKTIILSKPYLYFTITKSIADEMVGFRVKIGNLVVKNGSGNLVTTHIIN